MPIASSPLASGVPIAGDVDPAISVSWIGTDLYQKRSTGPRVPVDAFAAPASVAAGEFLTSVVSQWHNQFDVPRLRGPRQVDVSFGAPVGVAAGEFLPSFASEWHHQFDLPKLRGPRGQDSSFASPPAVASGEFLASYVSQWLPQHDLAPRFYGTRLDSSHALLPAQGFVANFVAQWHHQWDLPKLALPRSQDGSVGAPVWIAAGEFLPSFVSEWHHQHDVVPRHYHARVDGSFSLLPAQGAVQNYVSQWWPHHDLKPLKGPRAQDASFGAPVGVAPGEFLISFVAEWHHQHNLVPNFYRARLDSSFSLLADQGRIGSFAGQWDRQHDLRGLPLPRPFDSSFAIMVGAPGGEFLRSDLAWLPHDVGLKRRAGLALLDVDFVSVAVQVQTFGWGALSEMAGASPRARASSIESIMAPPRELPLLPQWAFVDATWRADGKKTRSESADVFSAFGAGPGSTQWFMDGGSVARSSRLLVRAFDEEAFSEFIRRRNVVYGPVAGSPRVQSVSSGDRVSAVSGSVSAGRGVSGGDRTSAVSGPGPVRDVDGEGRR